MKKQDKEKIYGKVLDRMSIIKDIIHPNSHKHQIMYAIEETEKYLKEKR